MPSSYYTHASGKPANQTRGLASEVRYELDSIAASFDLLPSPTALASGSINYALDTGLTNAYVVSVSSAVTAYSDGFSFFFKPLNNNSGASTLNVNTLGLKAIVRPDGTAVQLNDIVANQILKLTYNSSYNGFQLDTDISYANQAAASASAAAISESNAAASAAATAGAIVAERSASRALTNLTGITVVSGGASITGNSSVTGTLEMAKASAGNAASFSYTGSSYKLYVYADPTGTFLADGVAASGNTLYFNSASNKIATYINSVKVTEVSSSGLAVTGQISNTGTSGVGYTFVENSSGNTTRIKLGTAAGTGYIDADAGSGSIALGLRVAGTQVAALDGSGNLLMTGGGSVGRTAAASGIFFDTNSILPSTGTGVTDNTVSVGSASYRWTTIYATTGAINTSDARAKTKVRTLEDAEVEAAKAFSKEIGIFHWLDAVAKKGDKARKHVGFTVQRAIEIMEAHGLDPMAYAFICHDVWGDEFKEHPAIAAVEAKDAVLDEDGNLIEPAVEAVEGKDAWTEQTQTAGDRYAFRYDQLNLFIARGIEARLAALEARA